MESKAYEILCLIEPGPEEEARELLGRVRKYIEDKNGMVGDEPRLTKKHLSYPILKKSEAYVAPLTFFLRPELLTDLEEFLAQQKQILRYFLVRHEAREQRRRIPRQRITRPPEKKAFELAEIDKKLEEILGT